MPKNSQNKPNDLAREFLHGTSIDVALARGVLDALRRHERAGVPIAVGRNGRAVLIRPEQIDTAALERRIASRDKRRARQLR